MSELASSPGCDSCGGSGEIPTDFGPADCPDCGGAGYLPPRGTLVEWRLRDLERSLSNSTLPAAADVKWLVDELRLARDALTEVLSLAHDVDDPDGISTRIRFAANRALGLYEPGEPRPQAS